MSGLKRAASTCAAEAPRIGARGREKLLVAPHRLVEAARLVRDVPEQDHHGGRIALLREHRAAERLRLVVAAGAHAIEDLLELLVIADAILGIGAARIELELLGDGAAGDVAERLQPLAHLLVGRGATRAAGRRPGLREEALERALQLVRLTRPLAGEIARLLRVAREIVELGPARLDVLEVAAHEPQQRRAAVLRRREGLAVDRAAGAVARAPPRPARAADQIRRAARRKRCRAGREWSARCRSTRPDPPRCGPQPRPGGLMISGTCSVL